MPWIQVNHQFQRCQFDLFRSRPKESCTVSFAENKLLVHWQLWANYMFFTKTHSLQRCCVLLKVHAGLHQWNTCYCQHSHEQIQKVITRNEQVHCSCCWERMMESFSKVTRRLLHDWKLCRCCLTVVPLARQLDDVYWMTSWNVYLYARWNKIEVIDTTHVIFEQLAACFSTLMT